MHLAQFHPVHSVHSEGEIFVKAAPSHYATSLCPCHYVGTLVPPQWHDCDMPLAQLCQQGGTSMALYRLFQRSCRERFNVNRNYTPQQHEQLYAPPPKSPTSSFLFLRRILPPGKTPAILMKQQTQKLRSR